MVRRLGFDVEFVDKGIGDSHESYLADLSDEARHPSGALLLGSVIFWPRPCAAMLRSLLFNHWYHHRGQLVVVPNLFRVLGNAPAALAGYLDFGAALGKGAFDAKLREQIALAVAESNQCGYCLSAHTFVRRKVGLSEQQIADARHANAEGGRADATLKLALEQCGLLRLMAHP